MPAILFGSLSTIADTSELQRQAFNQAFRDHGLDWEWDRADYQAQLRENGGQQRIAAFAEAAGQQVDADAVHRRKSELFQEQLTSAPLPARPGVADTIRAAKERGVKVGLVTTTSAENVAALLNAVSSEIDAGDFDVVVDASRVPAPKPDPAAYRWALDQLSETGSATVAVEDNLGGVASARAAGLTTVAFPNENTADHDFNDADLRVDAADPLDAQLVLAALSQG